MLAEGFWFCHCLFTWRIQEDSNTRLLSLPSPQKTLRTIVSLCNFWIFFFAVLVRKNNIKDFGLGVKILVPFYHLNEMKWNKKMVVINASAVEKKTKQRKEMKGSLCCKFNWSGWKGWPSNRSLKGCGGGPCVYRESAAGREEPVQKKRVSAKYLGIFWGTARRPQWLE